MQYRDTLHRFNFENTSIRGNTVHLHQSFIIALQNQDYPDVLRNALGELMAAGLLLAATLKMYGALVLQIQGRGALKLLVVECCHQQETGDMTLRATAKFNEHISDQTLMELIGNGQFMITLDPKNGGEGYQGIVPIEGGSVSEILENYMRRSEQIETSIWLACDGNSAAGMLLQKLPERQETDQDAWNRTNHLASTVQNEELLELPVESLLRRLFHEEDVRLYEGQAVRFHCSCSRDSVSNMLRMLGKEEIESIIEERGELEVHCDFCNQHYRFDKIDSEQLFITDVFVSASHSRH
ncbi:33 kDa chaperonin [Methylophilaceae bacterium]|nr:33 kDa chaperonin [Methylophilaceae bacterium]